VTNEVDTVLAVMNMQSGEEKVSNKVNPEIIIALQIVVSALKKRKDNVFTKLQNLVCLKQRM
jgi:hypothetical protein